jgi:transcriptional regulator with XRE-family HTH domain
MVELIKKRVEYYYISGPALRAQRKAAGLSLRQLCNLMRSGLGADYIIINRAIRQLSKQTVWRMERMFEIELEPAAALIIRKIFEK